MNKLVFFFFFFFAITIFAQKDLDKVDYKYLGLPYYPEQFLSKTDSLKWPIEFDISIDVKDIKGLDISKDEFMAKLLVSSYSNYGNSYVTEAHDTISLLHDEFFEIYIKENNLIGTQLSNSKN